MGEEKNTICNQQTSRQAYQIIMMVSIDNGDNFHNSNDSHYIIIRITADSASVELGMQGGGEMETGRKRTHREKRGEDWNFRDYSCSMTKWIHRTVSCCFVSFIVSCFYFLGKGIWCDI